MAGWLGKVVVVIESGPVIVRDNCTVLLCAMGDVESVTVMFTVPEVAAAGVPEMAPVDAFIVRPVGRPVADHVYDGVPPAATTVVE